MNVLIWISCLGYWIYVKMVFREARRWKRSYRRSTKAEDIAGVVSSTLVDSLHVYKQFRSMIQSQQAGGVKKIWVLPGKPQIIFFFTGLAGEKIPPRTWGSWKYFWVLLLQVPLPLLGEKQHCWKDNDRGNFFEGPKSAFLPLSLLQFKCTPWPGYAGNTECCQNLLLRSTRLHRLSFS